MFNFKLYMPFIKMVLITFKVNIINLYLWSNKMTIKELKELSKEDRIKYYDSIEITEPSESINEEEVSLEEMINEFSEFSMTKEDKDKLHEDLISLS